MVISGLSQNYEQLSSAYSVNSSADDAAGLAIANKLETQSKGMDAGSDNAAAGQDLLKVADGGLSSIQNSLQRMRELSIQASSSAIYSSSDLKAMQKEIDELKKSIQDTAKGTQYNTMSLLDGSMADLDLATNPSGGGMKIQLINSTLEKLGIADYDITGKFDISALDKAIEQVSSSRSGIGAAMNALDSVANYNKSSVINQTAAQSKIQDLDIPKTVSDMKKNELLENYRMAMEKKKMEQENLVTKLLY